MKTGTIKELKATQESTEVIYPVTPTNAVKIPGTSMSIADWMAQHGDPVPAPTSQIANRGVLYDSSSVFCLSGASFASSGNGWFEVACRNLGVAPMNKAVSGSHVSDLATGMYNGTFWTPAEFEQFTHLVIMFSHNYDISLFNEVEDDWTNYSFFQYSNDRVSTRCFDYIIRKYRDMCYAQRLVTGSKWFGTTAGKPCNIILTTNWHDSRTRYNDSVRKVCEKWRLPLVAFDECVGFTRNQPLETASGESIQMSLKYSGDTEVIDGVTYGWHPQLGQAQYIQQKMAKTFCDYLIPNAI